MRKFLLFFLAVVATLFEVQAQTRSVTGKVTSSEDGNSLPGVNVVLKGTTNGTVTDADGNFRMNIPDGAVLLFSFIGLASQEVTVGDRSVIDVQLALDVQQLSEIVVTGSGVAVEKRKLAIAVESISADKLPPAPTASVDQALVGKIAGAQISSVSGTPGAQVQILLRGINTLQRGTQPMILLDGVQLYNTTINTIDLASVERVEVVQGAASASIYGAQGANGVIQIFTKKGKAGKINIDFSSSIAQNEYLNIGGLRKADLHAFGTDAAGNVVTPDGTPLALDPTTLQYNGSIIYDALDPTLSTNKPYIGNMTYYDHFDQFFTKASVTNLSARVSGASDKIDFSFAASKNHQESNVRNGGYNDRSNLTSNIGIELAKGLTLRSISQLAYTKNTVNHYIYGVFNARPFVDFNQKNTQGLYTPNSGGAQGVNAFNPNYWTEYSDNNVKLIDVVQNLQLTYKFPKFVELDTKYGLNFQESETIYSRINESENLTVANPDGTQLSGYNFSTYFGTGPQAVGFVDDMRGEIDNYGIKSTFQNWISKATINFDLQKDFNMSTPIRLSTLLLYDWRKNVSNYNTTYSAILPVDPPYTSASGGTFRAVGGNYLDNVTPLNGQVSFVTFGYLINQRIEFGEVAGISGGFRSDYSSAFGSGSKPFTFPRGDAYFRLSGLSFWDNSGISNVLLDWKLRAAYGKAGIQPFAFDRYPTLPAAVIGSTNVLKVNTISANPDLNVEVSKEIEIGTDVTFNVLDNTPFLNNINIGFTYWKRATENAIWAVDGAPSTGLGQVKTNAFAIASNGIQASLSTMVYKSNNFNWNMTTNFTKATSEITDVVGGEVVLLSNAGSTGYVLTPGRKIGQLFGYLGIHSVGELNPKTGEAFIPAADQANWSVASNGWVVNNTTKLPFFSTDLHSFGDPNPKFNMSFINDFGFKGYLTFGFQIDWVQGSHLYNQTKEWMYRDGIHSDYQDPITINGETGAWTAFYRGVYAEVARNGTKNYFLEDASFVRLRNVNIALDLARMVKLPMRSLQIVLTGRNLLTATKYSGMDPELNSGNVNTAWDRGTDHNSMPNFKTYQVGLNVGF